MVSVRSILRLSLTLQTCSANERFEKWSEKGARGLTAMEGQFEGIESPRVVEDYTALSHGTRANSSVTGGERGGLKHFLEERCIC